MARAATKPAANAELVVFNLPEMLVINEHVFVKSAYVDPKTQTPGTPMYSLELGVPTDDAAFGATIDFVADELIKEYGDKIYLSVVDTPINTVDKDGNPTHQLVRSPFLNGNNMAKKRADKGKVGDAYKGKFVLRCNTAFNWMGQDADGGIAVYDEDVKRITPFDNIKSDGSLQIYNGCYGIAKVALSYYDDSDGNPCSKLYLKAFQKTKDGEPLTKAQDHTDSFKPVGRAAPEEGGRRTRRG